MAENLTLFSHHIPLAVRERINGHKALVLWFTGLSGSGKSSIAGALESILVERYQAHTCFWMATACAPGSTVTWDFRMPTARKISAGWVRWLD